ncbi:ATP-dependent metallopeptidase FtsH/Yme1/Tma family protein [bacterium]|nr:ATP-dependent metallopeptidase FtsH/Yme1/Tma family protein [bacterium]
MIASVLFVASQMQVGPKKPIEVSFSEFMQSVDADRIESVTYRGSDEIIGKYKPDFKSGSMFTTVGDTSSEFYLKKLEEKGITPNWEKEPKPSFLETALISWVPTFLILFIFFLFMRQLQSGSSKAMSFGQSKAKVYNGSHTNVRFKDVAGIEEAKEELVEIVEFLKNPKKFTKLGGRIPRGVLLVGPPGTGKTLLAKAIAGEAGAPFHSISGSDFVEMFVGVGASRVRSLFESAKKSAPCLIFIDEIDAVGRHRGAGLGGGHDEREQTLNQLLVEMDGFEGTEGVILLAATNRVDVLDPALLRPGRFDRRIHVNKPDVRGRQAILEVHTRKTPLAGDVDLSLIARGTPGFAGADLENLVNEAALHAARRDQDSVHNEDFESAKDKVMMGSARRSMSISEKEKKHTAYHEAGHAIVGRLIEGNDPVHKVTIIPRGQALGLTMTLPEEDSYTMTKAKCEAMISFLMGGRIAEEITFGHLTSGASNDIERATQIARKMVTEWGMSEKLGPLNFGHHNDHVFLGREMGSAPDYGVETGRLIDSEIQQLVKQNYDRARKVLEENKDILEAMSLALIERETIDMADIKLLMERKALPEFVPTIQPKSYSDSRDEEEKKESEKGSSDIAGKAIDPSDPVKA